MNGLESAIMALETELLQTATRHDAHRVDALLCDDFVEFGASGRVWTKPAIITALSDEPATERRLSDFRLTSLASDTALVTYRVERDEAGAVVASLRSSVWVLEGDRWRMKFHQGTLTQ